MEGSDIRVSIDTGDASTSSSLSFKGGDKSALVLGLQEAKRESNDALSLLVGQAEADLREEDMEVDRDEEEPIAGDGLEDQLAVVKPRKKKGKASSSTQSPLTQLHEMAHLNGVDVRSEAFAALLDKSDPLAACRDEFCLPHHPRDPSNAQPALYFCGNSLGLMPRTARACVEEELLAWEQGGVEAHFSGTRPWAHADDFVREKMARVVGAETSEVVVMNGLTTNLHLLMVPFYQPTATRFKIMIEKKAFPSDLYAVESQISMRGFEPSTALLQVGPREGEHTLRTQDILDTIESEGDSVALLLFSGIQYYTGQFFEMEAITAAAQAKGCKVGWDLAHAVGNVPVQLHAWNVDFAVWCSYKYLNSGPGGIAGAFIHQNHHGAELQRLGGWWSQNWATRFDMNQPFDPIPDAYGFRLSNPPILQVATLRASLDIFDRVSMSALRQKSELITGYLQLLLQSSFDIGTLEIITPNDHSQRGCQLSIFWKIDLTAAVELLEEKGVICDVRKPNVTRIAPTPLYNSFRDVWRLVQILQEVVDAQLIK